jgi:hypothetical protein
VRYQADVPDSLDTGYSGTLTPQGVNAKGEVVATVAFESTKTLKMRYFRVGDGQTSPDRTSGLNGQSKP